jgi:NADH pyrophosphatase NudC (nudix superfamily)
MGSVMMYSVLDLTHVPSQPYPANLMVGFYATGDPSESIRLDLDKELEGTCCMCLVALA